MMKIADADFDRIGRKRTASQHTQADRAGQQSDHVSSLTFLLDGTGDRGLPA
jgi:hypothetical protein